MKFIEFTHNYRKLGRLCLYGWGFIIVGYFLLAGFQQVDFNLTTFISAFLGSGVILLFIAFIGIYGDYKVLSQIDRIFKISAVLKGLQDEGFLLVKEPLGYGWDIKLVGFVDNYQVDIDFDFDKEKGWINPVINASPSVWVKNWEEGAGGFYQKNSETIKELIKSDSIEMHPFTLISIDEIKMKGDSADKALTGLIQRMIVTAKKLNYEPMPRHNLKEEVA